MRWIIALLFLVVASPALAQGCGPTNPNCTVPTAPFGTSDNRAASTAFVQQNAATAVNITAFGAKCDGVTDDSAAINAAFQAVRTAQVGRITAPSGKVCMILNTINATNLDPSGYAPNPPGTTPPGQPSPGTQSGIIIDVGSSFFRCEINNGLCIDNLNSKHVIWQSLNLIASCVPGKIPRIGLQMGIVQTQPQITAAMNTFNHTWINGCYSLASVINYASEALSLVTGVWRNSSPTGYVFMIDCINFTGISSTFVTVNWVGSPSCGGPSTYQMNFQQVSASPGQSAMWFAGVTGVRFDLNTYVSCNCAHPVVLYQENVNNPNNMIFLSHMETSLAPPDYGNQAAVLITGNGAVPVPVINGFRFWDPVVENWFSLVDLDFANGITGATISDVDIEISDVQNTVDATFTVFGKYNGLASASVPATGSGTGCTAGVQTFTVQGGTGIAATVRGTVTGGVLFNPITLVTVGNYRNFPTAGSGDPPSPATLTGGGCATPPQITFTTSITGAPITIGSGRIYIDDISLHWQAPVPAGTFQRYQLCSPLGCQSPIGTIASPGLQVGPSGAGFSTTNQFLNITVGGLQAGGITGGLTWIMGLSGIANTVSNGVINPQVQAKGGGVVASSPRGGFGSFSYSDQAATPAGLFAMKSHSTTVDTTTAVINNETVSTLSSQGADGNKFQELAAINGEVDAAPVAGLTRSVATSATLSVPGAAYPAGPVTLTLAGGTCSTQPAFTATAAGGIITPPITLSVSGKCTTTPTNPAATTCGACGGAGATLQVSYSALTTQGQIQGRHVLRTASTTFAATSASISPGDGLGSGYTAGDVLTDGAADGVCGTRAQFTVATINGSGGILTLNATPTTAGSCTTLPSNPVSMTGGTGAGGKLVINFSSMTDALKIDSAQQLFAPQVAQTPGGKKILCIDDANGHIYKANGGAC